MKAVHIPTWNSFELLGGCYLRHEDESLWIAVSYLDGGVTFTNKFPVNEETGEILHPDYRLE